MPSAGDSVTRLREGRDSNQTAHWRKRDHLSVRVARRWYGIPVGAIMKGGEEPRSRQKHVTARTRTNRIRALNDEFRSTLSNGEVMITQGIRSLGQSAVAEILVCVCQFGSFKAENDPYGEHDFGSLQWQQQTIFWKIDYYDLELNFGSANPADPLLTRRVLTIMLAREY